MRESKVSYPPHSRGLSTTTHYERGRFCITQKNSGIPRGVPLFLVRSTGIEAVSTSLKPFIYKGFSHLLAKNTPIILGFRDSKFLVVFKTNFYPMFVFFAIDRFFNIQKVKFLTFL